MSNILTFGPMSISKLEVENRKGLLEVMAEVAENEGDLEQAASFYMQAATHQAKHGDTSKGLSVYVAYLISKSNSCRHQVTLEFEVLEDGNHAFVGG